MTKIISKEVHWIKCDECTDEGEQISSHTFKSGLSSRRETKSFEVCSVCGRTVCEDCYDTMEDSGYEDNSILCGECSKKYELKELDKGEYEDWLDGAVCVVDRVTGEGVKTPYH